MKKTTTSQVALITLFCALIMIMPQWLMAQSLPPAGAAVGERPPQALHAPTSPMHSGNGTAVPPAATDTTFVRDTGPTMDQYLYRDGGPIIISIPMDRVVGRTDSNGYLLDVQRLIDNGIVSPKVQLQLSVYDVDEDYSGSTYNPEHDRVTVNGQVVGKLTGANDTWSVTRLEVDVRHFKFAIPTCDEFNGSTRADYLSECDTAPTTVQNEIRIDIDTTNSGLVWAVEVDWAAFSFEAARPILLVHGKGGSNDGEDACAVANAGFGCEYFDKDNDPVFRGFRKRLNQVGFLTAITENWLGGEVSIAENAERLSRIIDRLTRRYGVDKINLLGHSKGGLDSRGYISDNNLNDDDDVAALITLATPHHGSALADLAADHPKIAKLIGYNQTPALKNVSEEYINDTFNPAHPARPGVRYYSVAADSGGTCLIGFGQCVVYWQTLAVPEASQTVAAPAVYKLLLHDGDYKGTNDLMVTVRSTKWTGITGHTSANSAEYGPYPLNHHSIRAAIRQRDEVDTTIVNLVADLLDVKANTAARAMQPTIPDEPEVVAAAEGSDTSVQSGAVAAGQTIVPVMAIDASDQVNFLLLWQTGDLSLTLVDANGTVITPSSAGTNIKYNEDKQGGGMGEYFIEAKSMMYTIEMPAKGQWQARITGAANIGPVPAEWVLLTAQQSAVTASLGTNTPWQRLNGEVQITSAVMNNGAPVLGAQVTGEIMKPDKSVQSIPLFDDGAHGDGAANDGVYGNLFTGSQFGIHSLSVEAKGNTGFGSFTRSAVGEVQFASGTASIAGVFSDQGVDVGGDSLFDLLRVNTPVQVAVAGRYMVFGELQTPSGTKLSTATVSADLGAGGNIVPLEFDGQEIWLKGGSGQFKVANVSVLDMSSTSLPVRVDYKAAPYLTRLYNRNEFQHDAVVLTGVTSDYGVDHNNNGRFDELVVNVGLDLQTGGDYQWNARLIDDRGYEFGWYSGSATLGAGTRQITFRFDGRAIGDNRRNGPYYLVDLALWGAGGYLNVIEVAQTQAYSYQAFESTAPTMSRLYLPVSLQIPYVPPTLPLLNGDFEAGRVNWREMSTHGWRIILSRNDVTNLPTHSGIWSAWLGGEDDEISYIEQEVTVPVGRPFLTYYHGIASEDACGYDFGGVIVNSTVVDQYDLCEDTSAPNWMRHVVNLSAYAGQNVIMQIRVETDGSLNSNLFVDDVTFSSSGAARAGEQPLEFKWQGESRPDDQPRGAPAEASRLLGPGRR